MPKTHRHFHKTAHTCARTGKHNANAQPNDESQCARDRDKMPGPGPSTTYFLALLSLLLLGAGGCTPPPAAGLAETTQRVARSLLLQMGSEHGTLAVDAVVDRDTKQQTDATKQAQAALVSALRERSIEQELKLKVAAMSSQVTDAEWVAAGTLTSLGGGAGRYRLHVSVASQETGIVQAHNTTNLLDVTLDDTPIPVHRDRPTAPVEDDYVDGKIATAETERKQEADPGYLERLEAAALIQEGNSAYEEEDWAGALKLYERALSMGPSGQSQDAYSGVYLCSYRLHGASHPDTRATFRKLVTFSLAQNDLAIQLHFRHGSTEFDSRRAAQYPMWLQEVAKLMSDSGHCLLVRGHASCRGSETLNKRLSKRRAATIQSILLEQAGSLHGKVAVVGVGYSECRRCCKDCNDDARDAIDRRVEFRAVKDCDLQRASTTPALDPTRGCETSDE